MADRSSSLTSSSASTPVRLEDVAARVGVSPSEVSRVLNGQVRAGKSVGAATRERILEAARTMNYSPNRAAQNLVRGRTDTVALMIVIDRAAKASPFLEDHAVPDELSPHYHEMIGSLTYTLSEYGIHLMLAQCGGPNVNSIEAMELLARSRSCDGLIITDMLVGDPRPAILDKIGLPYVIRGSAPKAGPAAVGMDNVAVSYEAVRYLHALGHRRILFYNIRRDLMVGQRRYEGMCQAREEFGLHETLEYHDDVHHENGVYLSLRRRLQQPNRPTAVFAEDEISALGAERAIAEAGLRVPQDVSVMTCLNARFMRLAAPHLTVMNVRLNEAAAEAGRLLVKMLRGEATEPGQMFLSPVLEERGSTGPPPK